LVWTIKLSETAEKQLEKLDRPVTKRLVAFLRERVAMADDPRAMGKALTGPLGAFWRYRVGDYRIICDIQDAVLTVLVVEIGDRKDVYKAN
jgi:mRNA interferase RelE/StbE